MGRALFVSSRCAGGNAIRAGKAALFSPSLSNAYHPPDESVLTLPMHPWAGVFGPVTSWWWWYKAQSDWVSVGVACCNLFIFFERTDCMHRATLVRPSIPPFTPIDCLVSRDFLPVSYGGDVPALCPLPNKVYHDTLYLVAGPGEVAKVPFCLVTLPFPSRNRGDASYSIGPIRVNGENWCCEVEHAFTENKIPVSGEQPQSMPDGGC